MTISSALPARDPRLRLFLEKVFPQTFLHLLFHFPTIWCIFSYASFSFLKLNFKGGKGQTRSCMETLIFGSIIWVPWLKTLCGVCFELQSALFKMDFQMGIKTTMNFKGKLQGSKGSPKSDQNGAKIVQQCVGHFTRKLTPFGPSFEQAPEGIISWTLHPLQA